MLYGWIIHPITMQSLATRRLALLTILSSLCIVLQIGPRPIPNVEFTSLFVFFVGAAFGVFIGGALGVIVMIINGFLSPWGFAGLMLPFQIAGMFIVGITGALYARSKKGVYSPTSCVETAVLGAFLTLVYDIITNTGVAISLVLAGTPTLTAFVTSFVLGAPFSLIHVLSNVGVFMVAFFPLTRVLQQFFGGENAWRKASLPT